MSARSRRTARRQTITAASRARMTGKFIVTMEHPSETRPKPARYEITRFGVALLIAAPSVITTASSTAARAG